MHVRQSTQKPQLFYGHIPVLVSSSPTPTRYTLHAATTPLHADGSGSQTATSSCADRERRLPEIFGNRLFPRVFRAIRFYTRLQNFIWTKIVTCFGDLCRTRNCPSKGTGYVRIKFGEGERKLPRS